MTVLTTRDLTPRIATEIRGEQDGLLVMSDNPGTMHPARAYHPNSGRLLNHTKLEGEEPSA